MLVATGSGQLAGHPGNAAAHPAPLPPLRVVSISPADGARDVDGVGNITVTYNQPLPASAPLPVLSPAIAGTWQRTGDAAVFTPATGFPARTRVTVTAGVGIATAAKNSRGDSAPAAYFTTARYSTLRLQEILAQLGYLPLSWAPAVGAAVPTGEAAAQLAAAYAPPPGTFRWAGRGYPSSLYSFWSQGNANTLDVGAITGFEADHGLAPDGVASRAFWSALLTAAAKDQRNTHGYSYAIASESLPETLTIWHDGREVFSSLANTGIGVRPTGAGHLPCVREAAVPGHVGHQPGRVALRGPGVLGVVLRGRRRRALLRPRLLRLAAVPGVRGAALQRREGRLPVPALRHPGHRRGLGAR